MTHLRTRIDRLLHRLQRENDLLIALLESGRSPEEAEESLQERTTVRRGSEASSGPPDIL